MTPHLASLPQQQGVHTPLIAVLYSTLADTFSLTRWGMGAGGNLGIRGGDAPFSFLFLF